MQKLYTIKNDISYGDCATEYSAWTDAYDALWEYAECYYSCYGDKDICIEVSHLNVPYDAIASPKTVKDRLAFWDDVSSEEEAIVQAIKFNIRTPIKKEDIP